MICWSTWPVFGRSVGCTMCCMMLLMHRGWINAFSVYMNVFNCSADFKDN